MGSYVGVGNGFLTDAERAYVSDLVNVVRKRLERIGIKANGLYIRITNDGLGLMRLGIPPEAFIEGIDYRLVQTTPQLRLEDEPYSKRTQPELETILST